MKTASELEPPKAPDVQVPHDQEPTNEVNNESVLAPAKPRTYLDDLSAEELKAAYDKKKEAEEQDAETRKAKADITHEPTSGTAPDKPYAPKKQRTLKKEDLGELKRQQGQDPESIEQSSGNQDSEYKFPSTEENMVHVELEERSFDPSTGQKLSKPKIQKFWPQEYADIIARNGLVGYTVTVKHKPVALDEIEKSRASRKK